MLTLFSVLLTGSSPVLLVVFLAVAVALTIAFSIGFYGIKGGIFSIITGGNYRVYGPTASFLEDNNDLALALLMVLPIFFFLAREETNHKLKVVLQVSFFLSIIAIIFTYSRGGFIGLAAITFFFLLKSKKKFMATAVAVMGLYLALTFAPEKWIGRMETIKDYEQSSSAQGRINAWHFAWNLALDRPLTGGGFQTFRYELFEFYAPDPYDPHDAHSIYFEVLGEHGFIALGLFLALLGSTFLSLRQLRRTLEGVPSGQWIINYCDMLELSLIVYMITGAFLGRAYFDLFYHLIAIAIILKILTRREYAHLTPEERVAGKPLIEA